MEGVPLAARGEIVLSDTIGRRRVGANDSVVVPLWPTVYSWISSRSCTSTPRLEGRAHFHELVRVHLDGGRPSRVAWALDPNHVSAGGDARQLNRSLADTLAVQENNATRWIRLDGKRSCEDRWCAWISSCGLWPSSAILGRRL